jgi:endonuclease/exonuclease/phosphatase family metal-dependent hydrolase
MPLLSLGEDMQRREMKRLLAHAAELYALDAPVVLAGDFNVVPTDTDPSGEWACAVA